jgi:hypothetical protein
MKKIGDYSTRPIRAMMRNARRGFLTARSRRSKAFATRTRTQVPQGSGQKKARPGSRADKVWRSFSVNEKACFGKQRRQYNDAARIHYPQKQQTSVSNISTIEFPEVSRCFLAAIVSRMRNVIWLTPHLLRLYSRINPCI